MMGSHQGGGALSGEPRSVPHIKDKAALAAQLREWAAIPDLKRVIVSHVTPIEDNPAEVLQGIAATL